MQQYLRDNAHSDTQNAALIWGCVDVQAGPRERERARKRTGDPGQACHEQKRLHHGEAAAITGAIEQRKVTEVKVVA